MLTACSEDSDTPEEQGSKLRLLSVSRTESAEHLDNGSITLYITNGTTETSGIFRKSGTATEWTNAGLLVKENTQYYLYGFMDETDSVQSSIAHYNSDYANGADLTLSNLPVFTTDDIRVVVGVKKVIAAESVDNYTSATEGHYDYRATIDSENYLNLLMAHLYMKLKLQFCVDKDYYALRRIHLKSVTLKSTYGATVTATIRLRNGYGLTDHVDYPQEETPSEQTPSEQTYQLLSDADMDLASETAVEKTKLPRTVDCPHCLFDESGTYLSITCTYDVYDTDGRKVVREGCTATNKIKSLIKGPGIEKTLTLTVAPTYLYVLSDDDLNNPTIKVSSE